MHARFGPGLRIAAACPVCKASPGVTTSAISELEDDMSPLLLHRSNLSHFARLTPPRHRPEAPQDGIIRNWIRATNRKWKRRKMIAVLESLNDRLLRDIGLTRGDIRSLVDGFDDRELGMVPFSPATQTATWDHRDTRRKAA